jgi:hypothetical protein
VAFPVLDPPLHDKEGLFVGEAEMEKVGDPLSLEPLG